MKRIKYIIIVFFIITLFNSSCVDDSWNEWCDECSGTGLWTDTYNNSHTCFATKEECMEWVSKHKPYDDVCFQCVEN